MVFENYEYDNHSRVIFYSDPKTELKLIHAQHRVRNGVCAGGIRFKPYSNSAAALTDVLRLSRAMTYKFSLADLAVGGAKTVIIGDSATLKTQRLLKSLAGFIESLGGVYIAGSDVGTNMSDLRAMSEFTRHVGGKETDTSEPTAIGTFNAIRATIKASFGADDVNGRTIAIQGAGGVGARLCKLLRQAGANVIVADINAAAAESVVAETGAKLASPDEIMFVDADLLSPCALGGVISEVNIPKLRVKAVCGCANNQLATPADGVALHKRGIAFVPDYIVSAGGIIGGALEVGMIDQPGYGRRIQNIYHTALKVLEQSKAQGIDSSTVAQRLAESFDLAHEPAST